MYNKINELSKLNLEKIRKIRRLLHQYPEIGFEEYKTSLLIQNTLKEENIDFEVVCKTGVLGIIKGAHPGKTVLLRADIDGLPMQELTDVEYKSLVDNMMHACGHDGHTASLLGAAIILNSFKSEMHGNVKLMFQPAEENFGGAEPMIKAGILENPKVDASFGLHLWGDLAHGHVAFKHGRMFASPDDFNFKIIGRGGHAAMPHQTIDPISIAVQVMNAMQNIVTRKIDPLNPVVFTIGSVDSGHTHNVIPNEAEVTGTFRCFDPILRKEIPIMLESILKGFCDANDATYEFNFILTYPPLINDNTMTDLAINSAISLLGENYVSELPYESLGGDDFSFLNEAIPSSYFVLGIKENDEPIFHHPTFSWNDDVLQVGSAILASIALDFLKK